MHKTKQKSVVFLAIQIIRDTLGRGAGGGGCGGGGGSEKRKKSVTYYWNGPFRKNVNTALTIAP